MRDVYAGLLSLDGDDPFESFLVSVREVLSWAFERYELSVPEPLPPTGSQSPVPGVSIRWKTLQHPERPAALWTMSWQHPDADDASLEWGVRARVGYDSAEAWLSLRVAVQPISTVLKPVHIEVGRPQVIPRLLEKPGATADGRRLTTRATPVGMDGVDELARLLLDPNRTLPVVVLTPAEDGRAVVVPDGVADRLAGLAHVVMLRSTPATFDLTNAVGKQLSVFLGAIRLYWPGLSESSPPRDHPLWLPTTIQEWRDRGRDFTSTLFGYIQREATFRLAVPPLQHEIEAAIDGQRTAEIGRLRQRVRDEPEISAEWLEEMDRALSRAEEAEGRVRDLQDEAQRLGFELDTAHRNIVALSRVQGRMSTEAVFGDQDLEAPTADEPRTVLEAVEIARTSSTRVVYLDSALEGARDSDYRQPARLLEALRALDEVAALYERGELSRGFAAAFQERGLNFAQDISYTDRNRFGADYERTYEGNRIALGPHLKFGQGSSDTCARIYWYVDEDQQTLVVGHVGKHLRTSDS